MSDEIVLSTWYARPLTRTEIQIFMWCGDERQAIALAKHVTLPDGATATQIATAVTLALVRAKEALGGDSRVEIVSAERRDDKRAH
jgi:hypothetical protein